MDTEPRIGRLFNGYFTRRGPVNAVVRRYRDQRTDRIYAMQEKRYSRIKLDPVRYSRDVISTLPLDERNSRLREIELAVNSVLSGIADVVTFQESLYSIIEQVLCEQLGYVLGRWEYDCEIEFWGGPSYMDKSLPDELIVKSEYPHGISVNWGDFEFPEATD
ncbi:MAG: hypothetical protein U0795_11475 [Pirellulales bacterium]